jgi:hypothetical protein
MNEFIALCSIADAVRSAAQLHHQSQAPAKEPGQNKESNDEGPKRRWRGRNGAYTARQFRRLWPFVAIDAAAA